MSATHPNHIRSASELATQAAHAMLVPDRLTQLAAEHAAALSQLDQANKTIDALVADNARLANQITNVAAFRDPQEPLDAPAASNPRPMPARALRPPQRAGWLMMR